MSTHALLSAVREFTTTIANPYDLQDLLNRLSQRAVAVADADGAGVMLAGRDGLGFAAASNEEVIEIEVLQDRIDSRACREAYTTNQIVTVEDLATDGRWPEYTERALELGFRAVLGVPMTAGGQTIGALNIYRRDPGPWSAEVLDAAEILTAMASAYVVHSNQIRAQHDLAEQLQTALESRDTIGQAKGLLMAHHGVDSAAAFEMLRSMSQDANIKLRDVAARIVQAESGSEPRPLIRSGSDRQTESRLTESRPSTRSAPVTDLRAAT